MQCHVRDAHRAARTRECMRRVHHKQEGLESGGHRSPCGRSSCRLKLLEPESHGSWRRFGVHRAHPPFASPAVIRQSHLHREPHRTVGRHRKTDLFETLRRVQCRDQGRVLPRRRSTGECVREYRDRFVVPPCGSRGGMMLHDPCAVRRDGDGPQDGPGPRVGWGL